MSSPYASLPSTSFWRSGVAGAAEADFPGLFRPRFEITPATSIATAGSCFAQHVGRHLRELGFNVLDAEPAPPGLEAETAQRFGFGLYSARHGNIYTVRQLLQLQQEAFGRFTPGDAVWRRDGRFFDALRPTVEPAGLGSEDAVRRSRQAHLGRVRRVLQTADVLVFTMGLVEAWVHAPTGTVYPTAPGVVADSDRLEDIVLRRFDYEEILADLRLFRRGMQKFNPKLRILLTVSPVPLTATATDDHVLVATTEAKATLRAVAGRFRRECAEADYFPSYEIVAGHPTRGRFYAPNLREVTREGVACVMRHFTAALGAKAQPAPALAAPGSPLQDEMDDEAVEKAICDEILLEAFGPATTAA
jgi:hypothetical protein